MTTTTRGPDFEDEVRAMLARRAADVPDEAGDGTPPRPTGLRIPLVAERRPPGPARWLTAAAVLLAVLGLAGVLVATGDDEGRERTGAADGPAATVPDRPRHLSTLPGGVDPSAGPLHPVGPVAATPEGAMRAVLEPIFGEQLTEPTPFAWAEVQPDDGWASWYGPLVSVDPSVWTVEDASEAGVGGSVTARRTDAGWQAVAVTSAALDLTGVAHTGDRLGGVVRVDAPAPLRVVVETEDGEVLGTSDLTTSATEPASEAGELAIDGLGLDPEGEPVVVRVEAGDRPGQVGLDGVRVAAYAAVVVTPGADPSAVVPTTAEAAVPPVPIEVGAGAPPGEGALWRAPIQRWGEAPGDAALAFARDAMGADDLVVQGDPERVDPGAVTDVDLRLVSGVVVPVRMARDGDDWLVLRVDEGRVDVHRGGDGLGHGFAGPASEVRGRDVVTVVRPDGSWERYWAEDLVGGLRPAAGWIVTVVDDEGRALAATGNPA